MQKRVVLDGKNASKVMDSDEGHQKSVKTYDCAVDLAPLALPPDLPPVILIDLDGLGGLDELFEVVGWLWTLEVDGYWDGWRELKESKVVGSWEIDFLCTAGLRGARLHRF